MSQKNNKSHLHLSLLSLTYMKLLRIHLKSVGSWPSEVLKGEGRKLKLYRLYLICQEAMVLIGQVAFIIHNFRTLSFFILGEVYVVMFLTMLTLVRATMTVTKSYGALINKFVKEFHLIHFKYMGGHFETMYILIHKISHYFTIATVAMMFVGMGLFNLGPLYNNFRNGIFTSDVTPNATLQFSIKYKWPAYEESDHFVLSSCLNVWFSYTCTILVCVNDLLLTLMIFQIIGHIEILSFNLLNIPRPDPKFYGNMDIAHFSVDENKMIHGKIVACVNHHRLIVSFVNELSEAFGPILAANYLFHFVGGCLLLLECSSGEQGALARYGALTIITFAQLIQISVIFEILGTKSENIIQSVYCVPWESMDVRNQRLVCILLHRVQKPQHVTALGLTTVGVQTMLQILKTTMSYFAFLRSKN